MDDSIGKTVNEAYAEGKRKYQEAYFANHNDGLKYWNGWLQAIEKLADDLQVTLVGRWGR